MRDNQNRILDAVAAAADKSLGFCYILWKATVGNLLLETYSPSQRWLVSHSVVTTFVSESQCSHNDACCASIIW